MTQHVIIGGGPAATNAVETIRQLDGDAAITLISDEPAHSRMALPYWLSGQFPREHTLTADDAYWQRLNVDARIGQRVQQVDPQNKSLTLADGSSLSFDALLLATGAAPVQPPIPGSDLPGVQPLWTLDHTAEALKVANGKTPRVVLVGGGFIGFIVLNAMHKRGWPLAVVEQAPQILPRMLDADSAAIVQDWLATRRIDVHCGCTVQSIQQASDGSKQLALSDGGTLTADLVILATGIRPNLGLLDGSGIETDEGILVNDRMQTNFPDVYAGGDVAQGPVLFSRQREIHAIQTTAVDHGRVAGANMAGREVHYPGSLSMNITDVCGVQCASFGNWQATGDATTISNPQGYLYRRLVWTGDQITGAIFIGKANDLGMLTDVGMVKGIMQTQTALGDWKQYLHENPFDIRRAYVGAGVADRLVKTTLLGRPAEARGYHRDNALPRAEVAASHGLFVNH